LEREKVPKAGTIPKQFVSAKLKEFAPMFYGKAESADCCLRKFHRLTFLAFL
jgi:hypothetical protein